MVQVLLSGTQGLALLCLAPTTKNTFQQVELSNGDDKHGSEIFAKTWSIHQHQFLYMFFFKGVALQN